MSSTGGWPRTQQHSHQGRSKYRQTPTFGELGLGSMSPLLLSWSMGQPRREERESSPFSQRGWLQHQGQSLSSPRLASAPQQDNKHEVSGSNAHWWCKIPPQIGAGAMASPPPHSKFYSLGTPRSWRLWCGCVWDVLFPPPSAVSRAGTIAADQDALCFCGDGNKKQRWE